MENKSSAGGLGFCGTLTAIFIVLKLCRIIDWSWVWVLAPMLAPTAIVLLVLIWVAYKCK